MKLDKYCDVDVFHDGLAKVKSRYQWELTDVSGNEVIPCKFASARDFSNGLALVHLDGFDRGRGMCFIDKTGREVI